jgi:hypothetical protein
MSESNQVPGGVCECGCGRPTSIAPQSHSKKGWIKGRPVRFIQGHNNQKASLEERFWTRVSWGPADRCWPWTGAGRGNGYGHVHRSGRGATTTLAHRLSWEIHHGPIPEGLFVLHRCDNPRCVNPAHLFLGTQKTNIHDMIGKGRRHNTPR